MMEGNHDLNIEVVYKFLKLHCDHKMDNTNTVSLNKLQFSNTCQVSQKCMAHPGSYHLSILI